MGHPYRARWSAWCGAESGTGRRTLCCHMAGARFTITGEGDVAPIRTGDRGPGRRLQKVRSRLGLRVLGVEACAGGGVREATGRSLESRLLSGYLAHLVTLPSPGILSRIRTICGRAGGRSRPGEVTSAAAPRLVGPARCGLPEVVCEQVAHGQADAARRHGVGPGLTPAGDDWRPGWLLAQHLVGEDLRGFRPTVGWHNLEGLIVAMAADRTTTSAALWPARPPARPTPSGTRCLRHWRGSR